VQLEREREHERAREGKRAKELVEILKSQHAPKCVMKNESGADF